jgi:2-methylcitrate dehydratase
LRFYGGRHQLGARITLRTRSGKSFEREPFGYEGGIANPLSWEREVEKFNWLSELFADGALRNNIIETVSKLDERSVEELTGLLVKVNQKAVYSTSRETFQ